MIDRSGRPSLRPAEGAKELAPDTRASRGASMAGAQRGSDEFSGRLRQFISSPRLTTFMGSRRAKASLHKEPGTALPTME